MAYTIHPYSTGKGNTTKSVNDNISSIMSRMVQIAGRLCEDYAGDNTIRCPDTITPCMRIMIMTSYLCFKRAV